jgi:hypothetical protein
MKINKGRAAGGLIAVAIAIFQWAGGCDVDEVESDEKRINEGVEDVLGSDKTPKAAPFNVLSASARSLLMASN